MILVNLSYERVVVGHVALSGGAFENLAGASSQVLTMVIRRPIAQPMSPTADLCQLRPSYDDAGGNVLELTGCTPEDLANVPGVFFTPNLAYIRHRLPVPISVTLAGKGEA